MFARVLGPFGFLLVLLALLSHQLGWVDGGLLLRVSAALALVVSLFAVVRLPWDLVFAARDALARQERAQRRGLTVDAVELAFAQKSATRALVLAIVLHLSGAGLAFAAQGLLGAELGGLLTVAFLLGMGLRPIVAFYQHARARLAHAVREAELPGPDAITLAADVSVLRSELGELRTALDERARAHDGRLEVLDQRVRDESTGWRQAITKSEQKTLDGLRDLERSLDRRSDGVELLAGVRALMRLAKE